MTSADTDLAAAVRRLHPAKDAAYRDAWKRRGEAISILANIARNADRLEYGLDGARRPGTKPGWTPRLTSWSTA